MSSSTSNKAVRHTLAGAHYIWCAIGAVAMGAILAAAGCGPAPAKRAGPTAPPIASTAKLEAILRSNRPMTEAEAAEYLGDKACAECHEGEFNKCAKTHHVDTLRPVTEEREGSIFSSKQVLVDPKRGIKYTTAFEGGRAYLIGDDGKNQGRLPADYVLGSAGDGYTFFSRVGLNKWMELRASYYPRVKRWDFTPKQQPEDDVHAPAGMVFSTAELGACLRCHLTTLRGDEHALDLDSSRLGIGCERCHGPGRAHVEAVRAAGKGKPVSDLKIERLTRAPAQVNEGLCGTCHKEIPMTPAEAKHIEDQIARFPAAALERSKCYIKSGALSCVTCHDPHMSASHDIAKYEETCLRCHSAPAAAPGKPAPIEGTFNRVVCKVNPANGCIGCHMPKQAIPIPGVRTTNHWIKIWPPHPTLSPAAGERVG